MKPTKTLLRKDYPRVRLTVKNGNSYFAVDLRRKHYRGTKFKWFKDRATALKYAAEVADKVSRDGLNSVSLFTTEPRLQVWTEQCAIFNKTIDDAIEVAVSVWSKEREVQESPYMAELLTVWMDDKTTNPLKPLRERSSQTIRQMASTFQADFGMVRIKEITADTVETYLKDKAVSNQTRKNLRSYLSQFFNWAIKKRYHHANPVQGVEITLQRETPQFFTVEQCQLVMTTAANYQMSSYFALCLFAGIRPKEVERMTWNNVNLATKEITLSASITKTKKDRLFVVSDNLIEWLKTLDQTLPLISTNCHKQKAKVLQSLKDADVQWIQDGLRQSFATFHYARHKSFELLRHDMGNSPDIIEGRYKGSIPSAEVETFWRIVP